MVSDIKTDDAGPSLYDLRDDNWQGEMSAEQLSLVFDRGASVNIFLRPSDKIKSRTGTHTYIENYMLPVHFSQGERYVSTTDGNHVDLNLSNAVIAGYRSYYAYSNVGPGFFNVFSPPNHDGKQPCDLIVMDTRRYEEMRWVVRDDYETIFDGESFERNQRVIDAIADARNFRVALTFDDGRKTRLDVDLLFYYPHDHSIFGYTKSYSLPTSFYRPNEFHDQLQEIVQSNGGFTPERSISIKTGQWPSYSQFFSDGTYSDFRMNAQGKREKLKNIKIFSSKHG